MLTITYAGKYITVMLLLIGLLGCSRTVSAPMVTPGQPMPGNNLTAPSQLPRLASGIASPLFLQGSEHLANATKNTAAGVANELVFSPTWDPGTPDPAGMSYAFYGFDLDGYTGPTELFSLWDTDPAPLTSWIGLSDFTTDSWDWHAYPASGLLTYDPVKNLNGSNELFVVFLVLDDTDRTLRYIRIGPDLPPEASLDADVCSGPVPLVVNFSAAISEDFEGEITKYEFDPEGDGTFIDNGPTATYGHTYTAGRSYTAAVRVTDAAMNQDVAELEIGGCWKHTWGGPDDERGKFICMDDEGNSYVVGMTYGFGQGDEELLVLKFSPSGTLLWQKTIGNTTDDVPAGIIFGEDGNLYIAGSDLNPAGTEYTPFLVSMDTEGLLRWQMGWANPGTAKAVGLAWGVDGSIYLACDHVPQSSIDLNLLLLKYNAENGSQVWARNWAGTSSDSMIGIDTDPSGNIYLLGKSLSFSDMQSLKNTVLVKFNSDGDSQLEIAYAIEYETVPIGIDFSIDHLLLITEDTVAKLTPDGELVWQSELLCDDNIWVTSVQGVSSGRCFISADVNPANNEGLLVGIDMDGAVFYSRSFSHPMSHESIKGLCATPDMGLILTGLANDNSGIWHDYQVSLSDPGYDLTAISAITSNNPIGSIDYSLVLEDVPPGSEVIDTGGGLFDISVQRFYPIEPSSW